MTNDYDYCVTMLSMWLMTCDYAPCIVPDACSDVLKKQALWPNLNHAYVSLITYASIIQIFQKQPQELFNPNNPKFNKLTQNFNDL